jgi:hypothetical protein
MKGLTLEEVATVFGENVYPHDVLQPASNTKGNIAIKEI